MQAKVTFVISNIRYQLSNEAEFRSIRTVLVVYVALHPRTFKIIYSLKVYFIRTVVDAQSQYQMQINILQRSLLIGHVNFNRFVFKLKTKVQYPLNLYFLFFWIQKNIYTHTYILHGM